MRGQLSNRGDVREVALGAPWFDVATDDSDFQLALYERNNVKRAPQRAFPHARGKRSLSTRQAGIEMRAAKRAHLARGLPPVNDLGEVVARYIYSDGDGARQNGVEQLATRLGANQDTSLPFSGSNVPEAIEVLDAAGSVTQTLVLSTNQVGSVQLVTDASTGEVVQRIEYDEFGRTLADSAPGMQPFGFAGGLYDSATNLVRFGARDYSSDVGRWVARDPVRVSAGTNLLLYVAADPLRFNDPNGLDVNWQCAWHSGKFVVQCSACVGFVAAAIADPELASKAALAGTATTQCINCILEFKKMDDKCNKPKEPKKDPSCEQK